MISKQPRILVGQVVAITGGARGIGKETARALLREGMKVAIGDVDAVTARAAADELGGGCVALGLDVTDRASFEGFVGGVEERLGPIDVLINNAGIMPLGPFAEEDDRTTRRMIDINVYGVLYGMKIVLPRMQARGRGHIVNIASQAGKAGYPGGATYSGTKHFVVGVSEAVRGELRGTPIEISCVMPVVVQTELAAGLGTTRGVKNVTPQQVAQHIVAALKLPRFDVDVPRSAGRLGRIAGVLPRGGREFIGRLIRADRILTNVDAAARRGYELRAARSEPGLEPAAEPRRLGESAG